MPNALLLGGELHGKRHPSPDAPDKLNVVVAAQPEKRTPTGYGGFGISPLRETFVVYCRLRFNGGPADTLVYAVKGYEPTQEDVSLVVEVFGSR